MGSSSSKPVEDDFIRGNNRVQRSSRASLTKPEQIESFLKTVQHIQTEIDIFAGNRNDSRYKEFQKMLTKIAEDVQGIKNRSKKQQNVARCDDVFEEIKSCLKRLETRVKFNEQNDDTGLDLGTVESNSFITSFNQRPPPPALLNKQWAEQVPPPKAQRAVKHDVLMSLERIEQEMQNLEKEIRLSFKLEDTKQCIINQKKIELLYTDLELITVDDHTPLGDKKVAIGKRLVKYNNQIKRFKDKLEKRNISNDTTQDGAGLSKPAVQKTEAEQVDDFTKVERLLEDLEQQVLTYEGVRADKKYKELEQILESYWTKLYSMDAFGEGERNRKSATIDRIKLILQELRKRADDNERQLDAIKNIHEIERHLKYLQKQAESFKGSTNDSDYIKLDQDIRTLWNRLRNVEEYNEHVKRSKARVINEIQYVLRNFSQDAKSRDIYQNVTGIKKPEEETQRKVQTEDAMEDEIFQSQLLKQVEEFGNYWNCLNYNLDVLKISKSEISMSIIDTFEKIVDGINIKKNALSIIEKRKSNSSLVIAKIIDNTEMLTKLKPSHAQQVGAFTTVTDTEDYYRNDKLLKGFKSATYESLYQPPDLIQQQAAAPPLSKSVESQIKVQRSVETIGEMQRVGTEAKMLLQQIRQSSCTKNDAEFNNLEEKLQQCKSKLDRIEYNKKNETIESNRRRASKTIQEAFRALEEKNSKSITDQTKIAAAAARSTKTQEIMDIDVEIQYFRQQIKNFTGVTKDKQYEKIKQGLTDSLSKLQMINDVHISKQESIRQIQQYHQELETKLAENQAKVKLLEHSFNIRRQTSQEIREIVEQVQKLKAQVERFTGPYKGVLYKQIEENLISCVEKLENLDSKGNDKQSKGIFSTKEKITKYLQVLEEKSSKPSEEKFYNEDLKDAEQFRNSPSLIEEQSISANKDISLEKEYVSSQPDETRLPKPQRQSQIMESGSPHHQINSLRDKLIEIKNRTETFSGQYQDREYAEIENQLLSSFEELKGINDGGHRSVIVSKEQYTDYIDKLLKYFEDKAKFSESSNEDTQTKPEVKEPKNSTTQTFPKTTFTDPTEELAAIEGIIPELKRQVDSFGGTASDGWYKDLVQVLSGHMTKLESIQVGNVAHVRERKRKLVQELENCKKLLNDKAKTQQNLDSLKYQQQLEKINEVLQQLQKLAPEVNNFVGVKNDMQYCYLDEYLIKLTIQLDNTTTFGDIELRQARKKAIREIQRNMDILAEKVQPENLSVEVQPTHV